MKLVPAAALLGVLIVAGCSNPDGSMGSPGSPFWFRTAPREVIAAHFQEVCSTYGFAPGTAAMAQCVAQEARNGQGRATAYFEGLQRWGNATMNGRSPAF